METPENIEEKFEILHYVPLGMCIIDRNYKVLLWNEYIEEWTGIKRDNIVGENIGKYFSHFKEPKYRIRIDAIFNEGVPVIFSSQLHKNIFPSLIDSLS